MKIGRFALRLERVHVEADERHLVGREERLDAAVIADDANEPLRDDPDERRREDERVDAELEEARDGRCGVVRVERREDEVAGERRLKRD